MDKLWNRIRKAVFGGLAVAAFFALIGTVGGIEHGTISIAAGMALCGLWAALAGVCAGMAGAFYWQREEN